jgi:hypothetical protein
MGLRMGYKKIKICKYNVDLRRYLMAKAIGEKTKKIKDVEDKNHTNVGSTSAKCSELNILGGQSQHSLQDQDVRGTNEDYIHPSDGQCYRKAINGIGLDTGISQLDYTHVFTVGMGDDVMSTER